jgi:hypothetical protein
MSEFIPNPHEGEIACKNATLAENCEEVKRSEPKLPEVGDTMRLAVDPWGYWRVVDAGFYPHGEQVIVQVEIKGFQKPVLTYEDR